MKTMHGLGLCLTLFLVVVLTTSALAVEGDTTLISLSSSEVQADLGGTDPVISSDGRYVAFRSGATNLVSGDTNGYSDIFVRDRQEGTTVRVSVTSGGAQGDWHSENPSISADGRFVAFESDSTNLVGSDSNNMYDIFVHDRDTDEDGFYDEPGYISTTRVSVASDGTQATGDSYSSSISADGQYVVFQSYATNLVAGDIYGYADIFLHDMQTGQTTLISVNAAGTNHGIGNSYAPVISSDGNFVAFQSSAYDLVAGDSNARGDVFVRDLNTGVTTRVSVNSSGTQGDWDSYSPCISADGQYVAFESLAENLVANDGNGLRDVFLRDTVNDITTLVSVDLGGSSGNGVSDQCSISPDGRYITFSSIATDLVSTDANGAYADVFVRDQLFGQTLLVSISSGSTQGNRSSRRPSISSLGMHVAFDSASSNLVTGDGNGEITDVFLHEVDLPSICEQVSEIPDTECYALEDLYKATNGSTWFDDTDWLVTDTPCTWSGVSCISGHVTGLNLDTNNLDGTLPASLQDLAYLEGLYLANNNLTGSLPPELGTLANLKYLQLDANALTGGIPSELGSLSQLVSLYLGNNPLGGNLPSSLGGLANLQMLFLTDAQLTGPIPSEYGNLSALQYMYLNDNQLTGTIPDSFANLDALITLSLGTNQLYGTLPSALWGMASLDDLYLENNSFYGSIPDEITNLSGLISLDLSGNQLRGEFPTTFTAAYLPVLASLAFDCQLNSSDGGVISFIDSLVPGWQDAVCPYVLTSTLADPDPSAWGMVNFTVTFSEPVTGVDSGDFTLTQSGGTLSGASVGNVEDFVGGGTIYNVSVITGTGDGLLRLDVIDSPSITNVSHGNAFQGSYTDGNAYVIDKTAPTVLSSTLMSASTTAQANVQFLVTFSEVVENITTADFGIQASVGITGASVTSVTGAGTTWTVTVHTGSGNGTLLLTVLAHQGLTDFAGNPLTGDYLTGSYYTINKTLRYYSVSTNDGYILESAENSSIGGTLNSTLTTFNLGDDAADKQYRAILHFNTASLPDNAVITKVTLKIRKQGLVGTDPFTILGGLKVDMRKPYFGTAIGLSVHDFQAAAGKTAVATFNATPVSGWYSALLSAIGRDYVNKTGTTQFRLYFRTDDNNDNGADYMKFFSGNYATVTARPTLIIEYYVP